AQAQRKYRALASELEDCEALLRVHMEREKEATGRVFDLARRLERASLPGGDRGEIDRLAAERDAAQADLDELLSARDKLNARRGELDNVVSRLKHIDTPAVHGWLVPVAVEAKPRKGETAVAALERVRGELHRARGEFAAVRRSPLPREELLSM